MNGVSGNKKFRLFLSRTSEVQFFSFRVLERKTQKQRKKQFFAFLQYLKKHITAFSHNWWTKSLQQLQRYIKLNLHGSIIAFKRDLRSFKTCNAKTRSYTA